MGIRGNFAGFRNDGTLPNLGCCDQQLVGWIAMERLRSWVDSTTICGCSCTSDTPGSASALSIQTPTVRSSFSLPYSTSFATSQHEMILTPKTRSAPKFEKVAVPRLQPFRSRNPPDPNAGVQQNHCRASQSSLPT